ncbi:MAG: acyltransferase [Pseudomonadota bacterium]|nr:acyltransferase [Pseudomonadota bacterium]
MSAPQYLDRLYRHDPKLMGHLEGLRALAALRIMLYHVAVLGSLLFDKSHYIELLNNVFIKLTLATSPLLDTFFLISGLVIGHALIKEYKMTGNVNLSRFFIRRFARIYPLYIFVLVLVMPFRNHNLHSIWSNILQVNNLLPAHEQYLIWTWSLAVDCQFYIIFAVILWFLAKHIIGKKTCCALAIGFFLLPFIITPIQLTAHHYSHFSENAYLMSSKEFWLYFDIGFDKFYVRSSPILFGVITAYLFAYQQPKIDACLHRFKKSQINAIALTLLGCLFFVIANDPIWFTNQTPPAWQTGTYWVIVLQRVLFSITFSLLLILAHTPKGIVISSLVTALKSALLRPFGRLSYTTYLIHPIVIVPGYLIYFATHQSVSATDYIVVGLLLVMLTYLLAVPIYLFLEQPAMDYLKQKWLGPRSELPDAPLESKIAG